MKAFCLAVTLAWWLCGCSTSHVPVRSQADAMLRADVSRLPGPSKGEVRLQLPASKMGTGPHDFYNLFAQYHAGKTVVYGLSIATSSRHSAPETKVFVNGVGTLGTVGQTQVRVWPMMKLNAFDVFFDREFAELSAAGGRHFTLSSERGTYEFLVPEWMFSALLDSVDRRLPEMRAQSFNVREVMYRSEQRRKHVYQREGLPEHMREAILDGQITLEMTEADVRASWGEPEILLRGKDEKGPFEVWRYPEMRLVLEKGVVTGWTQDSK